MRALDQPCRVSKVENPWRRTAVTVSSHKRPVVQEYLAGETLHGLAKRHDLSRNLIRIWVRKSETGDFDDDAQAADLLQAYEARIAALERVVGQQALELEFLKGALRNAPLAEKRAYTFVIFHVSSTLRTRTPARGRVEGSSDLAAALGPRGVRVVCSKD